jgi:DNA-binding MarR family transcriptional regulator
MPEARLPFDPIDRAGDLWEHHFGPGSAMRVATSVMRVQQLMLAALDAALKPFGLTFARYEVLVLLYFRRDHSLPLSKVGQRLMVHPASVTNAIDRLESSGLVERSADDADRRRTLARLTSDGREVTKRATEAVTAMHFAAEGLSSAQQEELYVLLRQFRLAAGDFPSVQRPRPDRSNLMDR